MDNDTNWSDYVSRFSESFSDVYSVLNPQKPPTPSTANINARQTNWTPIAIGAGALVLVLVIVLAVTGKR